MNEEIEKYARACIKSGLDKLTDANRLLFKKMYAPLVDGGKCDDFGPHQVGMNINDVVDQMPSEKLDTALDQVNRTIAKLN